MNVPCCNAPCLFANENAWVRSTDGYGTFTIDVQCKNCGEKSSLRRAYDANMKAPPDPHDNEADETIQSLPIKRTQVKVGVNAWGAPVWETRVEFVG